MLEKTCITCRRYKPICESHRNACPGAEILGQGRHRRRKTKHAGIAMPAQGQKSWDPRPVTATKNETRGHRNACPGAEILGRILAELPQETCRLVAMPAQGQKSWDCQDRMLHRLVAA